MGEIAHSLTGWLSGLSEAKQAVIALGAAVAVGVLIGGVGFETVRDTPEIARDAYSLADTARDMATGNAVRIGALEASSSDRDAQMERIEQAIEQIRLNQCLTLAELRGEPNADRCRNQ